MISLKYHWDEILLKLKMLWLYKWHIAEWRRDVWSRDWDQRSCCDGYMCGCRGSDYGEMWEHLWKTRDRS